MQKELGRYLLPVLRKKYKTDPHLKKYPPEIAFQRESLSGVHLLDGHVVRISNRDDHHREDAPQFSSNLRKSDK